MSELKKKLNEEMKASMKSGDALRLSVIRLLKSSVKNKEIERGKGAELNDQEVMEVMVSAVKQRNDAIEQFVKGNRGDLAEKERKEIEILNTFLPQPLTEPEVKTLVSKAILETGAAGIKDMGKVMKTLMPQILGRADNGAVSKMVKELLAS